MATTIKEFGKLTNLRRSSPGEELRKRPLRVSVGLCVLIVPVLLLVVRAVTDLDWLGSLAISVLLPLFLLVEPVLDYLGVPTGTLYSISFGRTRRQIDKDNEEMTDEFVAIVKKSLREGTALERESERKDEHRRAGGNASDRGRKPNRLPE